jgi:hypothetical protein
VGQRPSQTSHVCATSAKTAFKTAEGPRLPDFRKLGDGSYPVLRSRDENRTGQKIEGPKVNLFLSCGGQKGLAHFDPPLYKLSTFFIPLLRGSNLFRKILEKSVVNLPLNMDSRTHWIFGYPSILQKKKILVFSSLPYSKIF